MALTRFFAGERNCFKFRNLHIVLFWSVIAGFHCLASQVDAYQTDDLKPTSSIYPTLKPIEGRVIDESGWPVVGAVVLQHWQHNDHPHFAALPPLSIFHRVTTDARGKFRLEEIDHQYRSPFFVVHPDYLIQHVGPLQLFGDIVLRKGKLVSGRLVHHDGTAAKNVQIQVGNPPNEEEIGFVHGQTETNGEGRFSIRVDPTSYAHFTAKTSNSIPLGFDWFQTQENVDSDRAVGTTAIGDNFEIKIANWHMNLTQKQNKMQRFVRVENFSIDIVGSR